MLIPSKKNTYTPKWRALGQRKITTTLLVSFGNGQSHIIGLTWNINENKTPRTWFEISGERVIATKDFDKKNIKDLRTIDPKLLDKQNSTPIAYWGNLLPTEEFLNILKMAGIIDNCNPREGMKIVKQHISNVDKWVKSKKIDLMLPHIKEWLDHQKTIGIQRIPVHHSLFSSNMHISDCKFFR